MWNRKNPQLQFESREDTTNLRQVMVLLRDLVEKKKVREGSTGSRGSDESASENEGKKWRTNDLDSKDRERDNQIWNCQICWDRFENEMALIMHCSNGHADNVPETNRKNKESLVESYERVSKKNECEVCGKTFSRRYHLKTHSLVHTKEKLFKCAHCSGKFGYRHTLEKHQKRFHSNKRG